MFTNIITDKTQPITVDFLKKNFHDSDELRKRFSTTKKQTPVAVCVIARRDDKFTIVVYDEYRDNIFNAKTIGELITFLNLCGLNNFVAQLKF